MSPNDAPTTTSATKVRRGSICSMMAEMAINKAIVKNLQSHLAHTQQQITGLSIHQQQTMHYAGQQQPTISTTVTMSTPTLKISCTPQPQQTIAPTMYSIPGILHEHPPSMQAPSSDHHQQSTYVNHGGRGY